jgi:hypothetical protein
MTEEIMPKEDRMGKILSFIGGCIAGVAGVFAVAVMSEMSPSADPSDGSAHEGVQDGTMIIPESNDNSSK